MSISVKSEFYLFVSSMCAIALEVQPFHFPVEELSFTYLFLAIRHNKMEQRKLL